MKKKRTSSTNALEYFQTKDNIENEKRRRVDVKERRAEKERFEVERADHRERLLWWLLWYRESFESKMNFKYDELKLFINKYQI